MYQYDIQDQQQLSARLNLFQQQSLRHQQGQLSDEEFRPLRLQNGLYLQRHAPMLRVAVPYGMLSSNQLRTLARVANTYDKDYCHVSTRQNIQFNWIELGHIPAVLEILAQAEMHSVQTSGNCIRNVTSDPFAGIAIDELIDPRPYCEIIRQWSTDHPEFTFLPRKFKIAVSGSQQDRAIIEAHDIGLQLIKNSNNETGFKVWVGGGLGRTPVIGSVINDFLPASQLLIYLHAILRVYNRFGRRDNKYKARIKILVKALGIDDFSQQVADEYQQLQLNSLPLTKDDFDFAQSFFTQPAYITLDDTPAKQLERHCNADQEFNLWVTQNTRQHKVKGYKSVIVSLKHTAVAPGDIFSQQLNALAELAEDFSFAELRTTHQQNMVLADVQIMHLYPLWKTLQSLQLASPTANTLADMICCPGLDFCSLANAPSISVAAAINKRFDDIDYLYDIGDISLNISGCMNACAHHHLANIGILGVDKKGEAFYQVSLGGSKAGAPDNQCRLGKILGPAFSKEQIPSVIELIIKVYLQHRHDAESFLTTYDRIGIKVFKESIYGNSNKK